MNTEKQHKYISQYYNPVTFNNIEFGNARGLFTNKDTRLIIDGKFSVNIVDSNKFGKEIHFQVFGQSVKTELRNNSLWVRSEIYFNMEDLSKLIKFLESINKA